MSVKQSLEIPLSRVMPQSISGHYNSDNVFRLIPKRRTLCKGLAIQITMQFPLVLYLKVNKWWNTKNSVSDSMLPFPLWQVHTDKLFPSHSSIACSADFLFTLGKATLAICVKLSVIVTGVNNYCQLMDSNNIIHLLLHASSAIWDLQSANWFCA